MYWFSVLWCFLKVAFVPLGLPVSHLVLALRVGCCQNDKSYPIFVWNWIIIMRDVIKLHIIITNMDGIVVQWLALSPQSKKVARSSQGLGTSCLKFAYSHWLCDNSGLRSFKVCVLCFLKGPSKKWAVEGRTHISLPSMQMGGSSLRRISWLRHRFL